MRSPFPFRDAGPHRAGPLSKAVLLLALAAVCTLGAGCAAVQLLAAPGILPRLPPVELDLHQARLDAGTNPPRLTLDGSAGSAAGVRTGAGAGGGAGAIGGAAACLATGPLAPLCLVTVMPLATVVGAVGGAVVGAVAGSAAATPSGEGIAAAEARRTALETTFGDGRWQALLAEHARAAAHAGHAVDFLPALAAADAPPPAWRIEVAVVEVASLGTAPEKPYALRLIGRLVLMRPGEAQPVYMTTFTASTEHTLTTAQWLDGDAAALRADLDRSLRELATGLVDDFTRYAERGRWRRSRTAPEPAGS